MADLHVFDFEFEPRYVRPARLFGVTPDTTTIEIDDTELRVRFGRWHIATPRANITHVQVTGPYAFLKTAGPARLAVTDRGLTFATNSYAGVQLDFATPITGIDGRLRLIKHPNLTLTPREVDAVAELLSG